MSEFVLAEDPFLWGKGFVKIVTLHLNFRNFQNDLLVANPEASTATFDADAVIDYEKLTFSLVIYKMLSGQNDGIPVVVRYTEDNKNYLLSVEDDSVIFTENEAPELISSETSDFIFYLRGNGLKDTTLESSVKPGFSLGCSEEDSSLVLKPHSQEEPDSTTKLILDDVIYVKTTLSSTIQKKIPYMFWNINVDLNIPKLESTVIPMDREGLGLSELLNVFQPSISSTIIPYHIQNHMMDFLVADPEKKMVTFESNGQEKDEQATFYMNKYRESNPGDGLPVVLSCKVHNQNYLVCAAHESVILKLKELPKLIEGQSELIFYIKDFSPGHPATRLVPSADRKLSLACNFSERKVILKQQNNDEVDETMEFILKDKAKKVPQA